MPVVRLAYFHGHLGVAVLVGFSTVLFVVGPHGSTT
jgi:hypothetical protein